MQLENRDSGNRWTCCRHYACCEHAQRFKNFCNIAVLCCYICSSKHGIHIFTRNLPYFGGGLGDLAFITISQSLCHRLLPHWKLCMIEQTQQLAQCLLAMARFRNRTSRAEDQRDHFCCWDVHALLDDWGDYFVLSFCWMHLPALLFKSQWREPPGLSRTPRSQGLVWGDFLRFLMVAHESQFSGIRETFLGQGGRCRRATWFWYTSLSSTGPSVSVLRRHLPPCRLLVGS